MVGITLHYVGIVSLVVQNKDKMFIKLLFILGIVHTLKTKLKFETHSRYQTIFQLSNFDPKQENCNFFCSGFKAS